jgi:hypothetical protein
MSANDIVYLLDDLSQLTVQQRNNYYLRVCEALGLNPLTRPFRYIVLQGKLTLYATKNATDQLAKIHKISCELIQAEHININDVQLYRVVCRAWTPDNVSTVSSGVVALPKAGDIKDKDEAMAYAAAIANAMMRAETKAKRRAILSLVGLSLLDESELDTVTVNGVAVNGIEDHKLTPGDAPHPLVSRFRQKVHNFLDKPRPSDELLQLIVDELSKHNIDIARVFSHLLGRPWQTIHDFNDADAGWLVAFMRIQDNMLHHEAVDQFVSLARQIDAHMTPSYALTTRPQ